MYKVVDNWGKGFDSTEQGTETNTTWCCLSVERTIIFMNPKEKKQQSIAC